MKAFQTIDFSEAISQSLANLSKRYHVTKKELSLWVQYVDAKPILLLCIKDQPKRRLFFESLIGMKMTGLRIDAKRLKGIFSRLVSTISQGAKVSPERLKLVIYDSQKIHEPVIGVCKDKTPVFTMMAGDVIDIMGTQYLLN